MVPFIFSDIHGNRYLYSYSKHRIIYLNEVLCNLIQQYLESKNIDTSALEINDKSKVDLALERFKFLLAKGFLDEKKHNFITNIQPQHIPNNLLLINNICFEMTQNCNLSCVYCCYGDLYNQAERRCNQNIDINFAYIIIDSICKEQSNRENISTRRIVTLGFYGGEPLLQYSLIEQIILYAKAKENESLSFDFQITTNGLLIDKYIDFLVKVNCRVTISLDGDYFNSSYRISKKGINLYHKVHHNIQQIKKKYPIYFERFLTFNTVIHKKNSVVEVVKFFYENFGKTTNFSELSNQNVKLNKEDEFKEIYKEVHYEHDVILDILPNKEYLKMNHEIRGSELFFDNLLNRKKKNISDLLCEFELKEYPTMTCLPFTNKLFVGVDGSLHLCEHIGFDYPIGRVDVSTKKVVFDRDELAKQYSIYFDKMNKVCCRCAIREFCTVCMFQNHFKCTPRNEVDLANRIQSSIELLKMKYFLMK